MSSSFIPSISYDIAKQSNLVLSSPKVSTSNEMVQDLHLQHPEISQEEAVAQEFEAILLKQLFHTMRESMSHLRGGEEDSFGKSVYTEMLDEQLAKAISEGPGLGLKEMLIHGMNDLKK